MNTPESECTQTLVKREPSMDTEALFNRQNRKQHGNDRGYQGRGRKGKNNPLGADGKITKSFICRSCKHWACSCPYANGSEAEEVQILLMASEEKPLKEIMDALTAEAIGFILLD